MRKHLSVIPLGSAPKLGTAIMSPSRKFISEHEDEREPILANPVILVEALGKNSKQILTEFHILFLPPVLCFVFF